jgi:hypothetical protein
VLRCFENGRFSDGCGDVDDDKRCYGNDDNDKLKNYRQQMTMCLNTIILGQ